MWWGKSYHLMFVYVFNRISFFPVTCTQTELKLMLWMYKRHQSRVVLGSICVKVSEVHWFLITENECKYTSHSAYVAKSTKLDGVKIDGFLYPIFM